MRHRPSLVLVLKKSVDEPGTPGDALLRECQKGRTGHGNGQWSRPRAVIVAGVAPTELRVIEIWAIRRGLEIFRVDLEEPFSIERPETVSFVLFDARIQPALAIVECARLTASKALVPVIMIGPAELEGAALRAGVSVYLACPITLQRLLDHANTFVARIQGASPKGLVPLGDDVLLDLNRCCLLVDGALQALTPDRFKLLTYFIANPGRVITAQELVRQGVLLPSQKTRFRAAICELRKHLGKAAECIHLVRGYGYRYEPLNPRARTGLVLDVG